MKMRFLQTSTGAELRPPLDSTNHDETSTAYNLFVLEQLGTSGVQPKVAYEDGAEIVRPFSNDTEIRITPDIVDHRTPEEKGTYMIVIDDYVRKLLVLALKAVATDCREGVDVNGVDDAIQAVFDHTGIDEINAFVQILDVDMVAMEKASPGVVHRLCQQ